MYIQDKLTSSLVFSTLGWEWEKFLDQFLPCPLFPARGQGTSKTCINRTFSYLACITFPLRPLESAREFCWLGPPLSLVIAKVIERMQEHGTAFAKDFLILILTYLAQSFQSITFNDIQDLQAFVHAH
jgi:hypothetical protein